MAWITDESWRYLLTVLDFYTLTNMTTLRYMDSEKYGQKYVPLEEYYDCVTPGYYFGCNWEEYEFCVWGPLELSKEQSMNINVHFSSIKDTLKIDLFHTKIRGNFYTFSFVVVRHEHLTYGLILTSGEDLVTSPDEVNEDSALFSLITAIHMSWNGEVDHQGWFCLNHVIINNPPPHYQHIPLFPEFEGRRKEKAPEGWVMGVEILEKLSMVLEFISKDYYRPEMVNISNSAMPVWVQ